MTTPDLTTTPDRQLADWLFYDDVRRAERAEIDGLGCYAAEDEDHDAATCSTCRQLAAAAAERQAVRDEIARREAAGIFIEDPDEPTFEERHAPYGIEWQLEQRERYGR
jgi:hypothetical protein